MEVPLLLVAVPVIIVLVVVDATNHHKILMLDSNTFIIDVTVLNTYLNLYGFTFTLGHGIYYTTQESCTELYYYTFQILFMFMYPNHAVHQKKKKKGIPIMIFNTPA